MSPLRGHVYSKRFLGGLEGRILLINILLIIMIGLSTFDTSSAKLKLNSEAYDFQLTDINGVSFRLSDFRGKIVLLEFFVSSCGPCKPQMLELKGVRMTYPKEMVVMVSVSFEPSTDTVQVLKQLVGTVGVDWIVARDTIGISDKYGIEIAPTILLIDDAGVIRRIHEGFTEKNVLISDISDLLGGGSKSPSRTPSLWSMLPLMIVAIAVLAIILAWYRRRPAKRRRLSHTK
ncbi:MAG: TlpA family protein disulfide reductase [Candidatus Bathyarchaeia archaeon]